MMRKLLYSFLFFIFLQYASFGQTSTWTGASGTAWNVSGNWSGGIPGPSSTVIIPNVTNKPIISVVGATCSSITISSGAGSNSLTINSPGTLSVSGTITITSPTGGTNNTIINVASGTLSASNIIMDDSNNNNRDSSLRIGTGTVTVSNDIAMDGSSNRNDITFSGTGILYVGGTITGGTLIAGTGTVNYNGTTQTIGTYTYNNLILSNSGTKTFTVTSVGNDLTISGTASATTGANLTVSRNLLINSGSSFTIGSNYQLTVTGTTTVGGTLTFNGTGQKTFTGDVAINSGGAWNEAGNSTMTFAGNFQNNGNYIATNTSAHNFTGTSKSISGASSIEMSSVSVSGTYTNNNTSGFTASTILSGGGTLTNAAGMTLNIGGTSSITNLTATASGNIVNYNGSINQTIKSTTYSNLVISGSNTKTLNANTTVNNNLSIESGSTLDVSTNNYTLNVGGDFTNNGTFTPRTGTVALNGSGAQSFNVSNFYNLTLAGSGVKSFTAATTIVNALVITSIANLGSQNHSSASLTYGTTSATPSSWGSMASTATNKNSTYFGSSATGILNVTCAFFSSVNPITEVMLNTLDKTSSNLTTSPAYEDFTGETPTTLVKGQYYALTVKGNTTGYTNGYYTAYFDWNNNGVFTDSGENYTIGTINNSTGLDGAITSVYLQVPTTATAGNVKMRVVGRMGGYSTTPCVASGSVGQIEEYTVTLLNSCTGNPTSSTTVSSSPSVCPNAPFVLSLGSTFVDGSTYVWEKSTDGTNWVNATPTSTNYFSSDFSTAQSANSTVGDITLAGGDCTITGGSTGELILTDTSLSGHNSGFFISKPTNSNINAFTASFKYRIWGTTTGGAGADGMSLSYGDNVTAGVGGGENGEGNGIIIQFDTYDNEGVTSGGRVRVLYNNVRYFTSAINAVALRNSSYRNVVLRVDSNAKLSLIIAGVTVVSDLFLPGYSAADKSSWKFKFSARTGGENDKHSIDDLSIDFLDTTGSNSTFTTSQTVKTYYRAKISCGGNAAVTASSVLVDVTSATISPMTANACTAVAFTVTPVNGTNGTIPANTKYTWTAPSVTGGLTGGAANTVASATITGTLTNATSTAQTATYTVTPITGGCTGVPFTLTVTVNPKPTANAGTAVAAICQGATSAAMGGSIGGGATGGTWSGGSGTWNNATSPSGATYTAGASESGNITLTLTATGVSCSPAIVTKTITVNPKPTVANAGADQYGNGAFTLAANVPTAGTGTWSIASGPSTALTQFSNVNAANATFTPLGAGVYTLNWTITTASCGSSTDDVVLSNCVGNLIQNGDFSNGTNNWSKATTKGTKVEVLKENVYFPNGNSENYTAELDVEASLGQTVSVIPNVPYTLSFIYARRPGSSPTVAVDVKIIDGSNTITRNYTTSDTTNSSVFQTIQFTPSTSSIWIEFYNSLETTTLGSIVDNIVLLPTSQVNPVATTTPKGKFKTVDACNGASVQLDVENVPASGVSYSWTTTSTGVTFFAK